MSARDLVARFIGNMWGPLGAEDHADAILAALAAAGYKVLAREPTEEMISQIDLYSDPKHKFWHAWDAAPPATEQKE